MNLIVLSHMYPAQGNIYAGAFVVKQLTALTKIIEGEAFVVAPIPWAPSVLYFRDKWRNYAATKKYSLKNNIKIYRPKGNAPKWRSENSKR